MDLLDKIDRSDYFSSIDRHFARFMTELSPQKDPVIGLSAALVCRNNREGDVCIDLASFEGSILGSETKAEHTLTCPKLSNWREHLRKSDLVGKPGEFYPLIWDPADRLYLHRYWEYEKKLIDFIRSRNRMAVEEIEPGKLKRHLNTFFPKTEIPVSTGRNWPQPSRC